MYPNGYGWVWHTTPDSRSHTTFVHGPFKTDALARKDFWFCRHRNDNYTVVGSRYHLDWVPGLGPKSLQPL